MKTKNILITGCSRGGIGFESALMLQGQGYNILACVRSKKEYNFLNKKGFDTYKLDITKNKSIKKVLKQIKDKNINIDMLFNNAGYGQMGAIEDLPTKYLKEQFKCNVFGLHELSLRVIKIMRKQGYGKIINHSSVLGIISLKHRGAYNASKYAIEGLSDTLRLELMGSNIFVSLLNTGPVTSNFRKTALKTLENINIQNSLHKDSYQNNINQTKSNVPFNLPAIAVAKVVLKIAKTNKPKPRYYITKATYILGFLKRILSTSMLDKILVRV
jgi:short-subunit dehydrogenase